jgi:transcriptional regulator with XRE-family HTH domain
MVQARTTLGDMIKQYRKKNNLTQKQLSKLSHVSKSLIEKLERGVLMNPTIDSLIRIMMVITSPTVVQAPQSVDPDRLLLLTETFCRLAALDDQTIRFFNETMEPHAAILKTALTIAKGNEPS